MATRRRLGRALWTALAVVVSAYLLVVLGRELDLRQLAGMARHVSAGALATALGLYFVLNLWRTLRFRLLHGEGAPPLWPLFSITMVHNLLVRTLPLRSGELAYIALTRRHLGLPVGDSFGALVGARLFELLLIVVAGMTCLSLAQPSAIPVRLLLLGGASLALCLLGLLLLAPLVRFASRLLDRLGGGGRLSRFLGPRLEVAAARFEQIRAPRIFVGSLLLSVGTYGTTIGFNLVLLRAVGLSHDIPLLVGVVSLVSLLSAIPLSVSGLGVVEGSWTFGLTALAGLELDRAVSVGFFLHGCQLAVAVITGAVGYLMLLTSRRGAGVGR